MNFPLLSASNLLRLLFALVILTSSLLLLKKANSGPPPAQKLQEVPKATRRLFENRVPEDLPIKVKIKREKEKFFRDLSNGNWARDFELEVKNTGDKPIYFLFFYLIVPDAKIGDLSQGFSISYGRSALADLREKPNDQDAPIFPGETKFLQIEESGVRGWDDARAAGKTPSVICGVRLIFQHLSFGDGTGFEGASGAPRLQPRKGRTISRSLERYNDAKFNLPQRGGGDNNSRDSIIAGNPVPAFFGSAGSEGSDSDTELCDCVNANCEHGYVRHIDSNATNEHCYQCGSIDARDSIFARLRLWQDQNHNGVSESPELHTLAELGVEAISLDYKDSHRVDSVGNVFRYRAKIYGVKHKDLGRWAWDVLLLTGQMRPGGRPLMARSAVQNSLLLKMINRTPIY